MPGDTDDPQALPALLPMVFREWPDLRVEAIAADAAWDENWPNEYCLTRYGIPLVARRHQSLINRSVDVDPFDSPAVARYYGDGRVVCRRHDVTMRRDGFEGPKRELEGRPLRPGERVSGNAFRLRYTCPVDGRRHSVPMSWNWAALTYHPHSLAAGEPRLHARRLALLGRRNRCETLFRNLKIAHKVGGEGADRTRTTKEPTVEALSRWRACSARRQLSLHYALSAETSLKSRRTV
jgi:hypothetical protein